MAEYSIAAADLRNIESGLRAIRSDLNTIDSSVDAVYDNVKIVNDEVSTLAKEFHEFVTRQLRANNKANSQTRLIQIRQELEKKYGHYDDIRRTTTGILQADDLGIVKKSTISSVTEELMLSAPGYWLAPCLVALAAWINDQRELADAALKEGIKRNDEKTSLFFALICRRTDRKQAALKWTQRYLENQDEENLDRKTVIILDAFASGLLGADSEGVVSRQIGQWMDHLSEKPGFVEQQTQQWSEAINLKRKPIEDNEYPYLRVYSKTWPVLQVVMEGANLHAEILDYFTQIFLQEASTDTLKEQLDEILTNLVTDFDDEELPLRKEEKFHQFVVEFEGDDARARQNMAIEQTAFETHKDFTQLLTDAAMKPESSHSSVSTQKFSIALSKDWICNAYNDVTAQNRMKIPHEIELNVDTFNAKTVDGTNESELISNFDVLVEKEKNEALAQCQLSGFEQFCLYGGGVIGAIGLLMLIFSNKFLGLLAIIAGVGLVINHFSKKNKVEGKRQALKEQYEEKRHSGEQIIRAMLAEIVDFRARFAEKDKESQKVLDFLEQISPEQYVRKLSDTTRRVGITM